MGTQADAGPRWRGEGGAPCKPNFSMSGADLAVAMMLLSVPRVFTEDIGDHAAVQHEWSCPLDWIKPLPKFQVICYSRRFPSLAAGGLWVIQVCLTRELMTFESSMPAARPPTAGLPVLMSV
jgi:hypothetical protein